MNDTEKNKLGELEKDFLGQLDIWKKLTHEEGEIYRKWARDNWRPNTKANPLWHPVVRDEWKRLDESNRPKETS